MKAHEIQAYWQQARSLKQKGALEEAFACYEHIFSLQEIEIPFALISDKVHLMWELGYTHEARQWLNTLNKEHPKVIRLMHLYALSCEKEHDFTSAREVLEACYAIVPDDIHVLYLLASVLRFLGDRKKSLYYYQKILDKNPYATDVLRMIGEEHHYRENDHRFQRLLTVLSKKDLLNGERKSDLFFALGKAYDDIGKLAEAFKYYDKGSKLHVKDKISEHLSLEHLKKYFVQTMTKEYFNINTRPTKRTSKKPVFIVGMPRSGTTLTEQIITSLPNVNSVGEVPFLSMAIQRMKIGDKKIDTGERYPFSKFDKPSLYERSKYYLNKIEYIASEKSSRIVDKMPANFQWLGSIYQLFPSASIIHVRRHPIEICLSAYRLHFTQGQYWSYDFRTMGKYYRFYDELMQHWKNVLPEHFILEVKYEEILSDIETQSKAMARHIDVPWSKDCLSFHKTKRVVCTASFAQVRKPLYMTSMYRWRKYIPYLQPLLDEIGDLVEAYEKELENIPNN